MGEFKEIDVHEAKELIDRGNMTLVDIRDPDAYGAGHIEGAQHVTNKDIEAFVEKTDKSKPLVCYCYMGFSSQQAAAYFKEKGFSQVYSIMGGFTEWQKVHGDT